MSETPERLKSLTRMQFECAITDSGCHAELMDAAFSENLRSRMEAKFLDQNSSSFLWERFQESSSIYDPNGWARLSEFGHMGEVYLFFSRDDESGFWKIGNLQDLVEILGECGGQEFYICDQDMNFVICHNHHDYLIAAGTARDWLGKLSVAAESIPQH